jgi:hypothetical protein
VPDYGAIVLPPVEHGGAASGLGSTLFDCSPEKLSDLDPSARRTCHDVLAITPDNTPDVADRSGEVHLARIWARQLARKKAPLLLPCLSAVAKSVPGAGSYWALPDPFCLLRGATEGIDLYAEPGYMDMNGAKQ